MNENNQLLHPGTSIKPIIDAEKSKNLVEQLYGFKCVNLIKLNGYDDINYKIEVDEQNYKNSHIKEIAKGGYVLKILNSLDSKNVSFVEAQTDMMLYLEKNEITCPKPVKNCKGKYYSVENLISGKHVVRILEFLPGRIINEIVPTNDLFYDIGKYVAIFDSVLENFHHPAYDSRDTVWMLNNVPNLSSFVHVVDIEEDKNIVQEVISEFKANVLDKLDSLKKGIIHGDFNEQNILVESVDGEWKIKGILDFGDSQCTCYLFELAVAMTYMIIVSKDLLAGGYVLAGYSSVRNLNQQELGLLKVCIAARMCQSLVLGKYSSEQDPDNKYILSTAQVGWKLLKEIWKKPNEELWESWKRVTFRYKN